MEIYMQENLDYVMIEGVEREENIQELFFIKVKIH